MSRMFGHDYAESYDALYGDKDYAAECDVIEQVFRAHGDGSMLSLLDLGCGTGNHAWPLAGRGYEVVGVDRSDDMLALARRKHADGRGKGNVEFHRGDVRHVDLGRQFDAVLMMFAVLGYQLSNEDVLSAFATARRHLRPGGLFIFDAWYGPAVLHQRPSQRVRTIPTPDGTILRVASGEIEARQHLCRVSYRLWRFAAGRVLAEAEETHLMRYYFPLELDLFFQCSGFKSLRLGAFPEFDRDPDEASWNCLGVARAV